MSRCYGIQTARLFIGWTCVTTRLVFSVNEELTSSSGRGPDEATQRTRAFACSSCSGHCGVLRSPSGVSEGIPPILRAHQTARSATGAVRPCAAMGLGQSCKTTKGIAAVT